ncbi:MAG: hypothetical protein KC609_11610 [Myxococcales bacterium]|nr:hypothetical protein [Myxococcales bacterium]
MESFRHFMKVALISGFSLALLHCGGGKSSTADSAVTVDAVEDTLIADTSDDVQSGADIESQSCVGPDGELIADACTKSEYCNSSGVCAPKVADKEACNDLAHPKESETAVCISGFCKPGPFGDGKRYCVPSAGACGLAGKSVSPGTITCSADNVYSIECDADGHWLTPYKCDAQSCDNGLGRTERVCYDGGCLLKPECVSCFPGRFDETSKTCNTTCTTKSDCAPDADCETNVCVKQTKKGAGATCTSAADCQDGLFCTRAVDFSNNLASGVKVCCKTACDGACTGCDTSGSCVNVNKGSSDDLCPMKDADDSTTPCKEDGTCDGKGKCAYWPLNTPCKAASCSCENQQSETNCTAKDVSTCDGLGKCLEPNPVTCPPYTSPTVGGCNDAFDACQFNTCGSTGNDHSECDANLYCAANKQCKVRVPAFSNCYQLSIVSDYDDRVCASDGYCLKDNFGGLSGHALCAADKMQCISKSGNGQVQIGAIECSESGLPYKCESNSTNDDKPEWIAQSACSTAPKGCVFENAEDNTGIQSSEVCKSGVGCEYVACAACPGNTKFDPSVKKCFGATDHKGGCTSDAECPGTRKCYKASGNVGVCVSKRLPGETCNGTDKPCGDGLGCVAGYLGLENICCNQLCSGPCQFCYAPGDQVKTNFQQNTGLSSVPSEKNYTCLNYSAQYQTSTCVAQLPCSGADCDATTCQKGTGFCDGAGTCAYPSTSTPCKSTCTNSQQNVTNCDGAGKCNKTQTPLSCQNGCNGDVCSQQSCTTHAQCGANRFCNAAGNCQLQIAAGKPCLNLAQTATDDGVCQGTNVCAYAPGGGAAFCVAAGGCSDPNGTSVPKDNRYCTSDGYYTCTAEKTWSAKSSCDQVTKKACPTDDGKYLPADACYTSGPEACVAPTVCVSCGGFSFNTTTLKCNTTCSAPTTGCPTGYYCDPFATGGPTCNEKKVLGDTCATPEQCVAGAGCCGEYGFFCSTCCSDGACGTGKYCKGTSGGCSDTVGTGSTCNRDAMCTSGKCCGSKCAAQCCDLNDCDPGLYCNAGSCTPKLGYGLVCGGNDACQSSICLAGGTCGCSSDPQCQASEYCETASHTCKSKKGLTLSCNGDNECTSGKCYSLHCVECTTLTDTACDTSCDLSTHMCKPIQAVGGLCNRNAGCTNNRCCAGKCNTCCAHSQCGAGKYCHIQVDHKCYDLIPDFEPCTYDYQCATADYCDIDYGCEYE